MAFSTELKEKKLEQEKAEISETEKIDELTGNLSKNPEEQKLMSSVLESDKETIDKGNIIESALSQGLNSFVPDKMFEQLVKDYSLAEKIYGPSLLRQLSGYDPNYVERNIKIPEFQKELKKKIEENIKKLKDDKLIDKENEITEKGIKLASLVIYAQELDNLKSKGLIGEKFSKKRFVYGEKDAARHYKKGDRYKDISLKKSIQTAIRRSHTSLQIEDLKVFEREAKGQVYIVYAIDASGSMKGKKIGAGKKAGIALAFKAINEKDKVGLIVFGSEIKTVIPPTDDFRKLLEEIIKIRASKETDIVKTVKKAIELFPKGDFTKHLILLTDALPTVGEKPEEETLEAVSAARSFGITTSVVGINMDKKGKELAEKIVNIGNGRFYTAKDLEDIDKIIIEDYYSVA